MYSRCPGQDISNLRVKLYKCHNCGAEVEIFSDEVSVRCQKCGAKIPPGHHYYWQQEKHGELIHLIRICETCAGNASR